MLDISIKSTTLYSVKYNSLRCNLDMTRLDERQQFHPLVADWLKANNYEFQYEVKMPEYGRADFIARRFNEEVLIVECKTDDSAKDGRSIIQLLDYVRQIASSKAAYAIPSYAKTESIARLCEHYNVMLITIDVPESIPEIPVKVSLKLESSLIKLREKEAQFQAVRDQIKDIARQQMVTSGTAGISIRGITREMGLSAPAIYTYYDSLDDLITNLIVDAFNALAETLEIASQSVEGIATAKLFEVILAYRRWSTNHPIDFQLIYGNPIPGYIAPRDVTVPAVVRTFVVTVSLIEQALQTGELVPTSTYSTIPPVVDARLLELIAAGGYPISTLSMYLTMILWTQIHGIIYLELFNHIQSNVGDVDVFYETQIRNMLVSMGLRI